MRLKRTHSCSVLTKTDVGKKVILSGWVQTRRDHGGVIFVDLRDRRGITQVVFNPAINKDVHQKADALRSEYVIAVEGIVHARPQGMTNPKIKTGEIEVVANDIEIFNSSKVPPFEIEDRIDIGEAVRAKYRYLDLRRGTLQKNLIFRHEVSQIVRNFLSHRDFLELETPFLIKTTPEGARDYLVPSRLNPGHFYALPQSPQLFKQLFMISGFEKYFQLARCFRDEDLRADRQPEFTQIDIEMSFVDQKDVINLTEGLIAEIFLKSEKKVTLPLPFPVLTYEAAMARYGVDKPDIRFGLELKDITEVVKAVEFKVFSSIAKEGGLVKAVVVPNTSFSRKDFDDLENVAKIYGAKGLAWIKIEGGNWKSPISKFFKEKEITAINQTLNVKEGDTVFFVSDIDPSVVNAALGNLRNHLGSVLKLIDEKKFAFCWVIDFPLFEFDKEENRWMAKHHPFTSPKVEHIDLLEKDPERILSDAYDLVLNGVEIAGGSIRIHNVQVQEKVFRALKISKEEAQQKFGFLLEALQFGAPPHGGIAVGYDRLIALMCGTQSIRDVIAFPKTQKATCLMTEAPSVAEERQLKELHIKIVK